MCGMFSTRCTEDEFLLQQIGKMNRSNPEGKVAIYDARPYVNALANRVNKGGYENTKDYYTNCEIEFCNIGNIHAVSQAISKVYDLGFQKDVYQGNEVYFSKLESTGWL